MQAERYELHTCLAQTPRDSRSCDDVRVILCNGSIVEYEGELCATATFSPDEARTLANDLLFWANAAEEAA